MLLHIRYQCVVLLMWFSIPIREIMTKTGYYAPSDVDEDEKVADQLIEEFEREEMNPRGDDWWNKIECRGTAFPTTSTWTYTNPRTQNNLFYRAFESQFFSTTTMTSVFTETAYHHQFLDDSNLTFWESFTNEFDSCLHLPNALHQFRMSPVLNGLFRLSNVTVSIRSNSAVAGLLKTYYDVALWRMNLLTNPRKKDQCFHTLNRFFCGIQLDNLNQLKLQSVACLRTNLPFAPQYSPQYRTDSPLLNEVRSEVDCDLPQSGVYVRLDGVVDLYSNIPNDMEVNEISYFEEGCLEYFIERIQQRPTYYRDDLLASSPILSDHELGLSFPDGAIMSSNASSLLPLIQKFYNCQLFEILAIKKKERRLCYLETFQRNMDVFVTDAIRRLQHYALNINELIAFQSLLQGQRGVVRAFAIRNEPMFYKKIRNSTVWRTRLLDSATLHADSIIRVIDAKAIAGNRSVDEYSKDLHENTVTEFKETKINLQMLRTHIIHCVCIIVGVAFCLFVFMCFFTIWLSYMSHVARLKQEQEAIALLQSLRTQS